GDEMHGSRGNAIDADEAFERMGADAMRWYLLASPVLRGNDVVIEAKGLDHSLWDRAAGIS
ncbi:MAG: hypothetical protein ABSB75_08770, partial [Candidatus Limnocylindrales bacterium]